METQELLDLLASDWGYVRLRPPVSERPSEVIELLRDNLIWFSTVSSQDDIFEGRPIVRVREDVRLEDMIALAESKMPSASRKERIAQAKLMYRRLQDPQARLAMRVSIANNIMRLYAESSILCLFKTVQSQAYWNQYAGGGAGYALVFDTSTPWSMISAVGMAAMEMVPFQVQYVDGDRPVVEVPLAPADAQSMFKDIERALLTKSADWAHQREWRFIRIGLPGSLVAFPRYSLKAVVLGYAIGESDKARLIEVAATHSPSLPLFEVNEQDQVYRLGVRKI